MKTVVGLFDQFEDAQKAVRDLHDNGFSGEDLSMVARDQGGEYARYMEGGEKQNIADGAAAGAGIGAVLGGLGGLLVGLGALAIPGIGPVLAAGPIATTLAGAGIGAVAGGIVGALVDLGIPEEHANMYAEGIRRGGTLVVLRTSDEMADRAADIMNRYHPLDVDRKAEEWRQGNWTRFDSNAGEYDYDRQHNTQSTNIPVTGDLTDQGMGGTLGNMGSSESDFGSRGQTGSGYGAAGGMGQGSGDYSSQVGFDRDRNLDRGTGAYGSDQDYTTGTGGVGDRGMSDRDQGQMGSGSTASDFQRDRLNDQGQVGSGGTSSDYNRGSNFTTGAGGTAGMGAGQMGSSDRRMDDLTGDDLGDMSDVDDDDTDIPVTGGTPDVLYSETIIDEDIQPVDDNWSYFDNRFSSDFQSRYGSTGFNYNDYRPAYRFGYDLASNPQYRDWDWNQLEPVARQQWEDQSRQGGVRGAWADFKDHVRDAWDRVTNG